LIPSYVLLFQKSYIFLVGVAVRIELHLTKISNLIPKCCLQLARYWGCFNRSITTTPIIEVLLLPLNFLQNRQLPGIRYQEEP
jgi:hypothetical protein